MNLSGRLQAIISMVPENRCTADIGTDHGFVPLSLVSEGIAGRAIAADVRKGPLTRAEAHIREAGLADRIECRLGDGLSVLAPGEAEVIVIAGMGGMLMKRILEDAPEVVKSARFLVLSPHRDVFELRKYLCAEGMRIEDETMVSEDGKYYPVIRASHEEAPSLSETELWFGPVLLEKGPEVFMHFLEEQEGRLLRKIEGLRGLSPSETQKRALAKKEKMLRLTQEAMARDARTVSSTGTGHLQT